MKLLRVEGGEGLVVVFCVSVYKIKSVYKNEGFFPFYLKRES